MPTAREKEKERERERERESVCVSERERERATPGWKPGFVDPAPGRSLRSTLVEGEGLRVEGLMWPLRATLRVEGHYGFWVSKSDFWFRVSGLGFRVANFGFLVYEFENMVEDTHGSVDTWGTSHIRNSPPPLGSP